MRPRRKKRSQMKFVFLRPRKKGVKLDCVKKGNKGGFLKTKGKKKEESDTGSLREERKKRENLL